MPSLLEPRCFKPQKSVIDGKSREEEWHLNSKMDIIFALNTFSWGSALEDKKAYVDIFL